MDNQFWQDRKTLITGHTGFKGSWLTLYLNSLGAEVYGYSLKPDTNPSFFLDAKLEQEVSRSYIGDINDLDSVNAYFKDTKPSILFHLAAQPLVRESFEFPLETFETNILGTAKVIKAAIESDSLEAMVIITSDKCYKNQEKMEGYSEEDHLGGDDPYSASKASAEIVAHSLRLSFLQEKKSKLATVRAGNVIGGGDWAKDRLIPDCVKALQKHETPTIRNPNSIRPWQHVLEPLRGYIKLAENLCTKESRVFAEARNFAPDFDSQRTVEEVVTKVSSEWGDSTQWKLQEGGPKETNLLLLDNSKAKKQLNWKPFLDFDESIDMTVSWYKSFFAGEDVKETSLLQLKKYLERLNE